MYIFSYDFVLIDYYQIPSFSSRVSFELSLPHRIPSVKISRISTSGDSYNFCIITKRWSATPSDRLGYIQRKCGVDFRLSDWRLWKDPIGDKRHNTPYRSRYGVSGYRLYPSSWIYTKWVLFRVILPIKKTFTFSRKDLRKTLSQYVMSDRYSWKTLQM